MKQIKIKVLALVSILVALCGLVHADSRNATGTTTATVVFPNIPEGYKVTAVDGTSDVAGSKVTIKQRKAQSPTYAINGAGATSQTVIPLASSTGLASNDTVVVSYNSLNKAPWSGTVVIATSSNVTMSANLTTAVASGDSLNVVTTAYTIPVGSNSVNRVNETVAQTTKGSPLTATITATTACEVSVTAVKADQ